MEAKTETVAIVLLAGFIAAGCASSPPPTDLLEKRLSAVEEKLNAWPKERTNLANRIFQADKSATAGVRRARAETTALVESLRRETNRSVDPIQARLAAIESIQLERQAEIARLGEELAALRRDLDELAEKSRSHR